MSADSSVRPLRVFVVENHEDTIRYIRLYIEHLGYEVGAARDLRTALEEMLNAEWDVLISDIGLPDGDGWQLLEKLGGARPRFAIAMSGYGAKNHQLESRLAGYSHHLVKPFSPETLRGLLLEAAQLKESSVDKG